MTQQAAQKLCACGCGEPSPIARRTRGDREQVKGQPLQFISGHNVRILSGMEQARRSSHPRKPPREHHIPTCRQCDEIMPASVFVQVGFCSPLCKAKWVYENRPALKSIQKTPLLWEGKPLHRLVIEQALGRRLLPTELVHHKDHDRWNNLPENLEVVPDRAAHAKRHTKGRLCTVDGCERKHFGKGFCTMHYQRNRLYGNPYTLKME